MYSFLYIYLLYFLLLEGGERREEGRGRGERGREGEEM
jgi:hypothetical protein